ncbi:MAG: hypothetical protein HFJ91_08980 [Muribaculaceae bacterium]|nr:hypothetical protein [Muribaculaceae bacterium]
MKTAKWDKPLSKRAYDKIKEKALIGVTIAGREDDFEEFVETIDKYIDTGKIILPWYDRHDIYDIIFNLIKDDIDQAIRRSKAARERAAARRNGRKECVDNLLTDEAGDISNAGSGSMNTNRIAQNENPHPCPSSMPEVNAGQARDVGPRCAKMDGQITNSDS